jgi:PBSX family phage terminase large subunit
MEQSVMPAFLSIMDGVGIYHKVSAKFEINGGGTVWFRTATEPDSIVGITNVYAIWADEAGKLSKYFWDNIQGRSAFKNCPIMLTSTPYTMNWLLKEVERPAKKGRDDIHLVKAASNENPYFSKDEFERRKQTMSALRFQAMFGGEFARLEGVVYDCLDQHNFIDPFEMPIGTRYIAGVDWGHTHPFVIKVRAITLTGEHYGVSEYYKTGLTIRDMVQIATRLQTVWGIENFYCDPSEPGYILEFNRAGLRAVKANNDIRVGIDKHYELIKSKRYKLFKDANPYTEDEYENYHYPEPIDLKPDQAEKECLPVDKDNHCMDAERYITMATYDNYEKKTPKVAEGIKKQETRHERYRRLIKGPRKA